MIIQRFGLIGKSWRKNRKRLGAAHLAAAAAASLALALGLSACENVATYAQPSLVRVIDASYVAPALNVFVEGELLAGNIGLATPTNYGTVPAASSGLIEVKSVSNRAVLASASGPLSAGHRRSIFLTDNATAPNGFVITVFEDQGTQAATGHSAFRFLNQATKAGAVDVYLLPDAATLAEAVPVVKALAAGRMTEYISFNAQTVTMVVTLTGIAKASYTSSPISLIGGEARTVLIYDTQLVSTSPVAAATWIDAGPGN